MRIQVAPLFDPDQVGKPSRGERARALTGEDAGRNREDGPPRFQPRRIGRSRASGSGRSQGAANVLLLGAAGLAARNRLLVCDPGGTSASPKERDPLDRRLPCAPLITVPSGMTRL